MRTFTLKEVSKKINVKPATLKKWEKELEEYLDIPRTRQGARIYSEVELDLLLDIKQMYENKLSTEMILQNLQTKDEPVENEISEPPSSSLPIVSETMPEVTNEENAIKNADQFFDAMDTYKQTFLSEVKDEIRSVLRKEVVEEVKKEISKGTFYTVKSISDSIYKSSASTKAEIEGLSEHIEKSAEQTTERLHYLSKSIVNASHETSEEIYTLSKQLSESTEELAHYVDITNTEIMSLSEVIEKDREDRGKERDQFRNEITQREAAFQDLLTSFRDVAAAREKKWWKFWE
ncbi:MerR family transcriptional regulator [Bacillus sp. EB106-08-02-XG196]|uniref:MerR family transcriptional regulator n=1 Tax=Bacillus sp. EB106-08-02-XG196 TaxID=2737049 RepID=UPI0015C4AED3|nr:MerR family transcriptional regulator [Bacillus sp. EB106-08-02-XG196]NWQ42017.1 MerR family transcriptional regulator [Bacillus sp. EB106-08-02-XG196]